VILIPRNLSDNAYYNIEDTSIRLIFKHETDTLYKDQYERHYNLPGKYYKLLSTTNKIDTIHKLGIQIKFWAKIIMNEKGAYYGYCPKNGLLERINNINISLINGSDTLEITPFLFGDSTIYEVKWRTYNYKKTPYTWGNCPYFRDIKSMIKSLNNGSELGLIPYHDYVFWLDNNVIKDITFKPTYLRMKISLVDSTGTKHRQLIDSVKLE
jgi:hypothetical protein